MRYVVEARLLHRAFLLTIAGFVASGVAVRTAACRRYADQVGGREKRARSGGSGPPGRSG